MIAVLIFILHFLPWVAPNTIHLAIMMFLFAVMGQGWNILGGYAGQASFGHTIFFGTGAYISTVLYPSPWSHSLDWYHRWPPWEAFFWEFLSAR